MRVRSRVFAIALMSAVVTGGLVVRVVAQTAPKFEVDRMWPKPLPSGWILGSVTGLAVDPQDHIWIVHRGVDSLTTRTEAGLVLNPPGSELCCKPAPAVLAAITPALEQDRARWALEARTEPDFARCRENPAFREAIRPQPMQGTNRAGG